MRAQVHLRRVGRLVWLVAVVCLVVGVRVSAAAAAGVAIYYDSQRSDSAGQPGVWRMNVDGSGQQGFVAGGSEPSWSADGTKMIYLAGSDPHCDASGVSGGAIFLVGPDGENPQDLNGACGDARISPDGTQVAYESAPDHLSVLNVADPDFPVQLVPVPSSDAATCETTLGMNDENACEFATEPSWPGSSKVVYSNDTSEGGGLWSLPSTGGNVPTQVADANPPDGLNYGISGESVNPAGTQIAVSTNLETNDPESIRVIAVGGSTGTLVASAPAGHNYVYPQWSPDGKTIVFEDDGPNNASTIDSVPAAGGDVTVLTPGDLTARNPTFGPAGGPGISGTITTPFGDGLAGVTVNLSGTSTASTTTASDGSFAFLGLSAGTYTVTPAVPAANLPAGGDEFTATACGGGTIAAGSCQKIALGSGQSVTDAFTAAYTLSGTVTGLDGKGVSGAAVVIQDTEQGVLQTTTATTNAQGQIVASAGSTSLGVPLAPGSVVVTVKPQNGTPFFPVPGTGTDPDCVPSNVSCDVDLDHDRTVGFSACVVPDPNGTPLPANTPNPIPGAITQGDLEAVGCWSPQNASGSGTATIYDSPQPVRLDGVDVVPAQGTTLQLDTAGPTVTSNGPAQLRIAGWTVTPPLSIALNYQGGSTVSVSDQGAGTGPLAPNLFGIPISLGTGGPAGYGLPFTESAGQTSISAGLQVPVSTRAVWDPAAGVFEGVVNGVRGKVPSLGLGGTITTTNRNGLTGQLCGSLNDVSLVPWFGYSALTDGEISGAQLCYQFGKGLWTGSGMFKLPTALSRLAGDIYVTLTAQKAQPSDLATQFAGYKIQSFGLQFDHIDSTTFSGYGGEVRGSGIPIGLGLFLQSLGGSFTNDFATGNVSAITGTMGISYGPEIGLEVGNAATTELSLLRGDLAFTLAPAGANIGFWTYSLAGALTFARLSPLELQLAGVKLSYHANPVAPEFDVHAQLGGSVLGTGAVITVNGQSDSQNGFLLEGTGTVKTFGHNSTLDAILNNYLLGVCLSADGKPELGFVEDLSQPYLTPVWGCNLGAFKHPTGAGAAAVSRVAHLRIRAGLAGTAIAVHGAGAPPSFKLAGGGKTITVTPSSQPRDEDGVIVFSNSRTDTTYAGLIDPRPGRWSVSALRASPAITGVLEADPLPSARLSARVTPAGCRDEVAYRVALAAGERELLYSTQGTGHVFVGQPRGRSGRLAMTMLAGVRGRGQLVVYYLRDRNPVSVSTVASFRDAGSNGTERVSAIRLRGRKLTWTPTCGATRYEVTVSRPGQVTSSSADVPHLTLASDRLPVTLTIAAQDAEGVTIATGRRTIRH